MAYRRKDTFYARAKAEGYRSRAAYKLRELAQRYRLIHRGDHVVDLGCWPGGWLRVAVELAGPGGVVVGVDLVPLDTSVPGASIIRGDVRDVAIQSELLGRCGGRVDAVLSDMAPKLSGVRASDEARSVELAQTGLDVAERILRPGGRLLLKVFMSPHVRDLRARAEGMFRDVKITKPEASRKGSAEVYLVGLVRSRLAARIDAAKSGGTSIT